MSGTIAMITMRVIAVRSTLPDVVTEEMSAEGRPAMMFAKMMSDMPLPTPRWVMTSPSHMMMIAPMSMQNTTMTFSRASGKPMSVKVTP